jgi:hypothetical protein
MERRGAAVLLRAAKSAVPEQDSGMTDSHRRRWVIVVAVLALLVSVSLVTLLIGRTNDRRGGTATPAPSRSALPEPATAPSATATPLTTAPEGVTWELFEGVALPVSRTAGPTRIDGPVHAGLSRTPTGALLADAQINYRSLVDPDVANLQRVAEAQLAKGPGKTAYLNLIGQLDSRNDPPAGGYAQIVGFRFITYTPDLAVISLATRDSSGRIQVTTDTLRWVDGDWKLELPPTGLQQPQVVQDLTGYVPWSGIS